MVKNPITGNGYKKVEIDLGNLNCFEEPYYIDVGWQKSDIKIQVFS